MPHFLRILPDAFSSAKVCAMTVWTFSSANARWMSALSGISAALQPYLPRYGAALRLDYDGPNLDVLLEAIPIREGAMQLCHWGC